MAGCARPVRMTANSSLATATAFSIFSSASKRVSSITAAPVPSLACPRLLTAGVGILRPADQRADLLPAYCSHDVTLFHQVEDDNGQAVVHAQAHRRGIHELQSQAEHLTVVKPMEAHGIG